MHHAGLWITPDQLEAAAGVVEELELLEEELELELSDLVVSDFFSDGVADGSVLFEEPLDDDELLAASRLSVR